MLSFVRKFRERARDTRKKLVEKGFLMEETYLDEKGEHLDYMLGPNALILVSSWKNEEMAKWIKNLTIFLIGLTTLLVILTFKFSYY